MKMPREIAPQFVFFRMTVPAPAYSCSAPISQNQCLGVSNDGNVLYLVRSGDPLLPLGPFSWKSRCRSRRRSFGLPNASRDEETLAAVSANVSANLLGLGNAATPLGIQAARRMARNCGGTASDELCLLVVLNTASIQLLPTTVASVRAAFGSAAPFDILPAVWISSLASVTVGLLTARLLSRRKGGPA